MHSFMRIMGTNLYDFLGEEAYSNFQASKSNNIGNPDSVFGLPARKIHRGDEEKKFLDLNI